MAVGLAEKNEFVQILIVDDEPLVRDFLQEAVSFLGMKAEKKWKPLEIIEHVKNHFYNVILLDIFMPEISGLELIEGIKTYSAESKIIIMTGQANKEVAIQAIRLGAFDFLEKPIDVQILLHALKRALKAQKIEVKYKEACESLQQSQAELLAHKANLERVNKRLTETNKAMTILTQNIEREQQEIEKRIVLKTRSLIIPIIEILQQDPNLAKYRPQLSMLLNYLEDLTPGLTADIQTGASLSFTEMQIASLIKVGLKTTEIAKYLHIADSTVKTHRKNIRKKLGINNHQYILKEYLDDSIVQYSSAL